MNTARTERRALDREILRLAVPALGALVAEPLFLLTDTALVGHLGAVSLAGLGIDGAILQAAIGLLIFLAYATTPTVARRLGAGDRAGAIRAGIDGMWLALALGVLLAVVGALTARPLAAAFGAAPAVTDAAVEYMAIAVWGMPGMLLVIAATGLLRGLQDTRTPLVVAIAGFTANAALNAIFIYGLGWGIAGSAAGTVVAQYGMAAVYVVMAVRAARPHGVSVRPGLAGVSASAAAGGWLLLRTASLRLGLIAFTVVGAALGTEELAALQVSMAVLSLLAFVLDAEAIAAQAMVGHALGAGDHGRVRTVVRRLVQHSALAGLGSGVILAALAPVAGRVFTSDPGVLALLPGLMLVVAATAPLAGWVFVLDGILIGAGDARYLALTGLVNVIVYLPALLLALLPPEGGLVAVLLAQGAWSLVYLAARALTLAVRARGDRWMTSGAARVAS